MGGNRSQVGNQKTIMQSITRESTGGGGITSSASDRIQ